MDNKSQLGETITWIAGFLIIFFVVILFITFSLILAGGKSFFKGKDEIVFNKDIVNVNSQKILLDILDDKIKDGESVEEFIVKSADNPNLVKDILKEKFDDKLKRLGSCSYSFSAEYNPENLKEYNEGKSKLLYKKIEFGSINYADKERAMLSLFSDEIRIKIKFYLGECKNEHKS
jgi:hypothetical protein